jgi:hypothetical protein
MSRVFRSLHLRRFTLDENTQRGVSKEFVGLLIYFRTLGCYCEKDSIQSAVFRRPGTREAQNPCSRLELGGLGVTERFMHVGMADTARVHFHQNLTRTGDDLGDRDESPTATHGSDNRSLRVSCPCAIRWPSGFIGFWDPPANLAGSRGRQVHPLKICRRLP